MMAQLLKFYSLLFSIIINYVIARDETLAIRDYFYAGGSYVNTSAGYIFTGQMYVEKLSPVSITQPYPIIFIHGQGQTGTVCIIDLLLSSHLAVHKLIVLNYRTGLINPTGL